MHERKNCGSSQFMRLRDGSQLHFRRSGFGERICLFLHGFGEGCYVWREFIQELPPTYTSLALDLRGHGDSDWMPSGRYRIAAYVSDVTEAIAGLERKPTIIIGHSMGAEIAFRVARRLPSAIMGLVVVDFGPDLANEGMDRIRCDFLASLNPYNSEDEYISFLEQKRLLPARDTLAKLAANALKVGLDGLLHVKCDPALIEMLAFSPSDSELWALISGIMCPTLLVRGAGSAVLSRSVAHKMKNTIGSCFLQEVAMAGHAVMTDNPEGFAAAVLPFLSKL